MIRGIGCDLSRISRMEERLSDARFLLRWFTEGERAYIDARVTRAQTAAGIFAAKEAFVKALGCGFQGLMPDQIEIAHDALGAPAYQMNEKTRAVMDSRGVSRVFLSISHDGDYAMATAVAEGE